MLLYLTFIIVIYFDLLLGKSKIILLLIFQQNTAVMLSNQTCFNVTSIYVNFRLTMEHFIHLNRMHIGMTLTMEINKIVSNQVK